MFGRKATLRPNSIFDILVEKNKFFFRKTQGKRKRKISRSKMDSQIQCPVCTLYLHVGMNLQDHLNTHPKEQVISALVNMTLLQQRANDENSNNFECSRYEPLAEDLYPDKPIPNVSTTFQNQQQSITYITPISSQQTSHKVMIVNGTQVFHDRTGNKTNSRQIVAKSLPPLSIPARTFRLIPAKNYDGKIAQAIKPPPPYHASIQDSLTVRNAIQRNEINQITTQIQQSCSTNVFNVTTTQATSSSTLTANIDTVAAAAGTNAINVQNNESITNDENHNNDDQNGSGGSAMELQAIVEHSISDDHEMSDISVDPSSVASNQIQSKSVATLENESLDSDQNALNPVENTPDIRTKCGLKVLSNVQVSPNTILNVSSISSHNDSDTIPVNNMIIVGSIPSTSTHSKPSPSSIPSGKSPQSLLKSSSEPYKHSIAKTPPKASKGKTEVSYIDKNPIEFH